MRSMVLKDILAGLVLSLALPLSGLAHGPKDLPDDPQLMVQYKEGYAAYQQDDYTTALGKWRPLAEQGGSAAQLFLGFMHANGQGVRRNEAQAVYWYGEAAERDNSVAQVRLALMYRDGAGVAADRVKALFWVKMAGRSESHMQKIAQAIERTLEANMTPEDIAAAEELFHAQSTKHQ